MKTSKYNYTLVLFWYHQIPICKNKKGNSFGQTLTLEVTRHFLNNYHNSYFNFVNFSIQLVLIEMRALSLRNLRIIIKFNEVFDQM